MSTLEFLTEHTRFMLCKHALLGCLVPCRAAWGGVFGQQFMIYEYVPLYKCKDAVLITWMTESIKTLIKTCTFL